MTAIDDDPTVLVSNPRARRVLLRVSAVLASLIVLWLVVYAAAVVFVMNAGDFPGSAHMSDFSVFWGAARLGLQGEAAAAFDIVRLNETMDIPDGIARDDFRKELAAFAGR